MTSSLVGGPPSHSSQDILYGLYMNTFSSPIMDIIGKTIQNNIYLSNSLQFSAEMKTCGIKTLTHYKK